ncbi:MAG: serine--tRNA ligase [Verrucomicrobiota bacterium]
MIDIKLLRDDPEGLKTAVGRKKFTVAWEELLELDAARRQAITTAEGKRAEQKTASKEVGQTKDKSTPEFQEKLAAMKALSEEVKALEAIAADKEAQWKALFLSIPNVPDASVPDGATEEDNITVASYGDPDEVSKHALPHWDIPWFNERVDFERGVKATGAGFPFYVGEMARLVRGLVSFFLEEGRLAGYLEVLPPLMVNAASATATGQLPDKEGQMYHATGDDFYLIPTAEVPVTNFFREETFEERELPVYRCAYTPCFRREAGSWGAHVRGLNRLHQFDKVELVKWVHPEKSFEELESLRAHAENLLQKLGLPYRVLLMCAGDIGFPHAKQYDLEVWAGGQKRWLEVSSCSNFTDFQARRAGIRYKPQGGGKAEIVHTLNGSGLAIPRVLAALLENNLQADGSVVIPDALQPWTGFATLAAPSE